MLSPEAGESGTAAAKVADAARTVARVGREKYMIVFGVFELV